MLNQKLIITLIFVISNPVFAHGDCHVKKAIQSPVQSNEGTKITSRDGTPLTATFYTADVASVESAPETSVTATTFEVGFETDSSQLSESDRQEIANFLNSHQDAQQIKVVGYADRRGTVEYNQELSEKRAKMVEEIMAEK